MEGRFPKVKVEALYYDRNENLAACRLCPHNCKIKPGKAGICRVRSNENGKLFSDNYGLVCSIHSDPIEKKPLYHYFPGRSVLSIGSIGCNLKCKFCQNWEISQNDCSSFENIHRVDAGEVSNLATTDQNNIGVAYTYNEPLVWIEYLLDVAVLIKEKQLKNVMVTNGFINPGPLTDLIPLLDAFSVDLKGFTESFYKQLTAARLQPVLETLKTIKKSEKHLEITNLVIPNQNDDARDFIRMVDWINTELGQDTVLHISRYYPTYQLDEPPTPEYTLEKFYEIARKKLDHVYLGNIRTDMGQNTYCPSCNSQVISRTGYYTNVTGLDHRGHCLNCQALVIPEENMRLKL
jgi:pyruvate formate lyase activating enzyme